MFETHYALPTDPYVPTQFSSSGDHPLPLDGVFDLRQKTLKRKLSLIHEQIAEHRVSLEQILSSIETDLSQCRSLASNLPYCCEDEKRKVFLKDIIPLYHERRQRQLEYLRDTATLRRELLDTILLYQSLGDKAEFLRC